MPAEEQEDKGGPGTDCDADVADDVSSSIGSFAEDGVLEIDGDLMPPEAPAGLHSLGRPPRALGRSSAPIGVRMAVADPYAAIEPLQATASTSGHHVLQKTNTNPRRSAEDGPTNRLPKSLSTAYLMSGASALMGAGVAPSSEGGAGWVTAGAYPGGVHVGTMYLEASAGGGSLAALQPPPSPLAATPHTPGSMHGGSATTGGLVTSGAIGLQGHSTGLHAGPSPSAASAAAAAAAAATPTAAAASAAPLAASTLYGGVRHSSLTHLAYGGGAVAVGARGEGEEALQSLRAYVMAEAAPAEKLPTADVVWGQTERERVYNFLLHVPYQLERLIFFGTLLLVDSFLGVFTLLPLRCLGALMQLARGAFSPSRRRRRAAAAAGPLAAARAMAEGGGSDTTPRLSSYSSRPEGSGPSGLAGQLAAGAPLSPGAAAMSSSCATAAALSSANPAIATVTTSSSAGGAPPAATAPLALGRTSLSSAPAAGVRAATLTSTSGTASASASAAPSSSQSPPPPPRLSGSQLYDMLCLAILCCAAAVLRAVRPGSIYYWLKDITSEFLKMSVLSTAFDMSDKILSNFGNDVLEALSGTCTQWLAGKKRAAHVASDAVVAAVIVTLHALTLMCQALIVAVALNSSRNGLVALLIANNFVEIKSTVFKKWDSTRIWALVCADAVERFHLWVVLAFVVVEEMDSAASWTPPPDYLRVCGLMVAAEVVIDVVKHAVLGKFNDVRPGIYREFHQELCVKALAAQSHSAPRLLAFHHLAPAALALRIALTLFWLRVETRAQVWVRVAVVAVLYGVMCCLKLLFGYCIKMLAHYFIHYYGRKYGAKYGGRPGPVARAAAAAGAPLGQGAAAAAFSAAAGPPPTPTGTPVPAGLVAAVASGPGMPPASPRHVGMAAVGAAAGSPAAALMAAHSAVAAPATAPAAAPPLPGSLLTAPSLSVMLQQHLTDASPCNTSSQSGPAAMTAAAALADVTEPPLCTSAYGSASSGGAFALSPVAAAAAAGMAQRRHSAVAGPSGLEPSPSSTTMAAQHFGSSMTASGMTALLSSLAGGVGAAVSSVVVSGGATASDTGMWQGGASGHSKVE